MYDTLPTRKNWSSHYRSKTQQPRLETGSDQSLKKEKIEHRSLRLQYKPVDILQRVTHRTNNRNIKSREKLKKEGALAFVWTKDCQVYVKKHPDDVKLYKIVNLEQLEWQPYTPTIPYTTEENLVDMSEQHSQEQPQLQTNDETDQQTQKKSWRKKPGRLQPD